MIKISNRKMDLLFCVHAKLFLTLLAIICSLVPTGNTNDQSETQKVVAEFWDWLMEEYPSFALQNGIQTYASKFEELTEEAFERRKERVTTFFNTADNLDATEPNEKDAFTLKLFKYHLKQFIDGYQYRNYGNLNNVNFLEGPQLSHAKWIPYTVLNTTQAFDEYGKKLEKNFPKLIDEMMQLMDKSISENTMNHRNSMDGVLKQIEKLTGDPVKTPFHTPYKDTEYKLKELRQLDAIKLQIRGLMLVRDFVVNAFKKLKDYMEFDYIPRTRSAIGVDTLKDGSNYYRACLKWHLTEDKTPEEIHQLGQDEVQRIEGEMEKIMERMKGKGMSIIEFVAKLNSDNSAFLNSGNEILDRYKDLYKNRIQGKLSKVIIDPSRFLRELNFVNSTNQGPAGKYIPPSENSPAIFMANVHTVGNHTSWPTYMMPSIAMHYTVPGHHMQASFALSQNLEPFRRRSDNDYVNAVPFKFPTYSALVEGWSLYAESLGHDMGLFKSDKERFGQLCSEMLAACHLVVDTGIHAKMWTYDRAVEYIQKYTGLRTEQASVEVNRCVTWPGQATAAKVGQLRIKALRDKATKHMGDQMDLAEFHKALLGNGLVPIGVLEEETTKWINAQPRGKTPQVKAEADTGRGGASTLTTPWLVLSTATVIASTVLLSLSSSR